MAEKSDVSNYRFYRGRFDKGNAKKIDSFKQGNLELILEEREGSFEYNGWYLEYNGHAGYAINQTISIKMDKNPILLDFGVLGIESNYTESERQYLIGIERWEEETAGKKVIEKGRKIVEKEWKTLDERKDVLKQVFDALKDKEILEKISDLYKSPPRPVECSMHNPILYSFSSHLIPELEEKQETAYKQYREMDEKIKQLEKTLKSIKGDASQQACDSIKNVIDEYKNKQAELKKEFPKYTGYPSHSDIEKEDKIINEARKIISPKIFQTIKSVPMSKKEKQFWQEYLNLGK